jgi:transposase InsO family protein
MARKVTPMHARIVVAVAKAVEELDCGGRVNVRRLSRELGIAPKTFYKWAERYRAGGLGGLEERSRRPQHSPTRLAPEVEDAIVELRKHLSEEGLDAGAATVRWHLEQAGHVPVPSEATVWRCLVRRGFVTPQPAKRPKSSLRRFEAPRPNEWWQVDATEWRLPGGKVLEVINVLDDHSRLCVASVAVAGRATSEAAWQAFSGGAERYGLPRGCLSDNGTIFSGRLRGFEVFFEAQLRAAGVRPFTSRPHHPQTCGKVERFQQTLKKWLARHPAATRAQLQARLDAFRDYYNHHRPHRALGGRTPWERWAATEPATPGAALEAPVQRRNLRVNQQGWAATSPWSIGLGIEYAGRPATVVVRGTHATVFVDGRLVRDLELDPTRYYQPSGRPPGGRRRRPG